MANSRVDDEKLIILVQEHPFLWDLRDSRYKDNFLKKNTWDMIGNQLQINGTYYLHLERKGARSFAIEDGIVAKNKWRNLRDTFSRKLAELNQPSGSGYKHVRWKYFEQMSFLKDTLTSRPRSGNLEEVEDFPTPDHFGEAGASGRTRQPPQQQHSSNNRDDEVPPLSPDEIASGIKQLKSIKSASGDGLAAELFKM
uniref:uncharacterized protein LOC125908355 n=1 Tax=Anopheles coluzzii TaxID=1518534 RepID=UPI0020FFBE84|nr:uncharacterized protein LOC125908355 [Anopheles coluzzii]